MTQAATIVMPNTTTPGELVQAKTMCLALKIGRFGNSKKASLATAQFADGDPALEPDKALLRLNKTLIDSPELEAIRKFDSALTASIRKIAFNSQFKGGVYLLSVGMIPTVDELLQRAIPRRQELVDAAVAQYPTRVAETQERLGVAGNETDYPSVERFRATFYLEYSYITFETPTKLKAISAALFKQEAEKARAKLESVAEECQQTMRAGLLSLVDHLADRLSPDAETGKQKRLAQTTIGNLNDFLATFELRNVTDDAQLGEIVAKARAVMQGLDHKTLKSDDLIRRKVVEELTKVKGALDPLIVTKGRMISFAEDEGEAS